MAAWVENPPVMRELRVQSPGEEDPLEEEMTIHSSIFAWEILWTEEPGLCPWGLKESDMTEQEHGMKTHPPLKATCRPGGT